MAMIKLQTIIRKMANRIHESVRSVFCVFFALFFTATFAGKLHQNG